VKRHPALVPLSRQHHDGLALGVFIERDLRGEADPAVAERLRKQALDLWELELRGHFEVEERVLFPAVRDAIQAPRVVDELIREHAEMRTDFLALERAGTKHLPERLRALRKRLVRHIRTEERVLFEAVQASVGEAELADLGRRILEMLPSVCVTMGSARG
jgi:iron-sulfur cluster repair protein YtfE (RIC family)